MSRKIHEVAADELNPSFLALIDEVAETGEEIVITKNGEPARRLIAVPRKPKKLFGALADSIRIHGDIVAPIDIEWDAQK